MMFDDLPEARQYQTSPSGGRANRSSGPEEVEIGRVPEEPSQKD